MRAITFDRYGDPSVLQLTDLPTPEPGPTDVRIAIHRVGVNPIDVKLRSGVLHDMQPLDLPVVPGSEIAGVVDAVGTDVDTLRVGDEVFGWSTTGAYAQYALAPTVIRKPPEMSWDRAASLPVAGEAALRTLRILDVAPGDTLLIHGAGGNVGTLAAQLAIAAGATVVGTARPEYHPDLQAIGVLPITSGPDWAAAAASVDAPGITKVLDAAGASLLPASLELVDGDPSRIVTLADPGAFALGVTFAAGTDADQTTRLLDHLTAASPRLLLPEPQVFGLEHAAEAHAVVAAGGTRGKILLDTGR